MNTIATFDNTVGILVKAYLDGTLLKGHCCACAVGNICAAALGVQVFADRDAEDGHERGKWSLRRPRWQAVFCTYPDGQLINTEEYESNEWVRGQIDATGYTYLELARIEKAFETAEEGRSEAAEFAGLMAVVDVLADIHSVDLTAAEAAKSLFVKA